MAPLGQVARVLAPPYHGFGPGSRAPAYEWLSAGTICGLCPYVGALYMWAGPAGFVAPMVLQDRSLSPRTVWGSYTRKRTYSTGSVTRPPGMAAPYLLTPMPPASPEIFFFKVRNRIGLPPEFRAVCWMYCLRRDRSEPFSPGTPGCPGSRNGAGNGRSSVSARRIVPGGHASVTSPLASPSTCGFSL